MKGVVSLTAQSIANGVLSTMRFSSLKTVAAIVMAAGILTAGAGLLIQPAAEAQLRADSSRAKQAPEVAIASLEPTRIATPEPSQETRKTVQEQATSFEVDTDLMKRVLREKARAPGSIIQAIPDFPGLHDDDLHARLEFRQHRQLWGPEQRCPSLDRLAGDCS